MQECTQIKKNLGIVLSLATVKSIEQNHKTTPCITWVKILLCNLWKELQSNILKLLLTYGFFRDETIGRGCERGDSILDDDMQDLNDVIQISEHKVGCKEGEATIDDDMKGLNDEKQISEQVLSIFYQQNNKSSVVQVLYL